MHFRTLIISLPCIVCLIGCTNPDDPTKLLGSGDSTSQGGNAPGTGGSTQGAGGATSGAGGAAPTVEKFEFVPGEVIAKFNPPRSFSELQANGLDVAGRHLDAVQELQLGAMLLKIQFNANETVAHKFARTLDVVNELQLQSGIEYAHVDSIFHFSAIPTDPYYPQQWNYPAIHLPEAWDMTTGSPNVTIGILDTGRLDHPDLAGRWLGGYDFGSGDSDPTDYTTWHHGLHVAGILGAKPNNGIGGTGICWNCPLLPVKVCNDALEFDMTLRTVADAISWASDPIGGNAKVITMSFGAAVACDSYLQNAVNLATQRNTVVVAASGNDAGNMNSEIHTPAKCTNVIAVAATGATGSRANYANVGPRIDVVAPGGSWIYGSGVDCSGPVVGSGATGVLSTWALDQSINPPFCYRYLGGTSMATPHVAGVAALMLSINPDLKPAKILQCLKDTAAPVPNCVGCGAGLIDAKKAVICADSIFGNGFD